MSKTKCEQYHVLMTPAEFEEWQKTHPNAYINHKDNIICSINCDICGKKIKPSTSYLSVFTGHDAWGYESADSYDTKQICSTECLDKLVSEFKQQWDSEENDKTDFFKIESKVARYHDTE